MKISFKLAVLFMLMITTLMISNCGGGGSGKDDDNFAPDVSIDQPQSARSFLLGSEVRFSVTVTDPDGDIIGDNNIVWRSDRDGEIGRGQQITSSTLSQGLHIISVRAEDDKGKHGIDTVNIALSPPILPEFKNRVLGKIRNAKTGQLIESTTDQDEVQIELKPEGSSLVYDSLGVVITDPQLIADGRLVFQTTQTGYPYDVKVIAHAQGYLSSSRIITLKQPGEVDFELMLNEQDNLIEGASAATERTGVASNSGVLQQDISVSTTSNVTYPGAVQITLPRDTRITDANDQPLSGDLEVQAMYFSSLSADTLSTFPGGLVFDKATVDSVTDADWQASAGTEQGWFISGGFAAINIVDENGRRGTQFDRDVDIVIQTPKDLLHPSTNLPIQIGDELPLWSYNNTTAEWKYHGLGIVEVNATDTQVYDVRLTTRHLSWFNVDFPSYGPGPGEEGDGGDAEPGGDETPDGPDEPGDESDPANGGLGCHIDVLITGENIQHVNVNLDVERVGGGYAQTFNLGLQRDTKLLNMPADDAFSFEAWFTDHDGDKVTSDALIIDDICGDDDAILELSYLDAPDPAQLKVIVEEAIGSCHNPTTQAVQTWVEVSSDSSEVEADDVTNENGEVNFLFTLAASESFDIRAYNPRLVEFESQSIELGPASDETITFRFESCTMPITGLESISIQFSSIEMLEGNYQSLSATGHYDDGSTLDVTKAVEWVSADASTAEVSNRAGTEGQVHALKGGTVRISASLGDITDFIWISVVQEPVTIYLESIEIYPDNSNLPEGQTRQYSALGHYDNGNSRDITDQVTWDSSATDIATISNVIGQHGLVSAEAAGDTIISAEMSGITAETDLTVSAPLPADERWLTVAANYYGSYGIKADGTLWGWGTNPFGYLGDGSSRAYNAPVQIGTDTDWAQVNTDGSNTLAVKQDGSLWGWGINDCGQLGDSADYTVYQPIRLGNDNDWPTQNVGDHLNLYPARFYSSAMAVIKPGGSLWVWGCIGGGLSSPTRVGNDSNWVAVHGDDTRFHVINDLGEIWEVTDYSGAGVDLAQLYTGTDWSMEQHNQSFMIAVKTDGSIWTWGCGPHGTGTTDCFFSDEPELALAASGWPKLEGPTNLSYRQNQVLAIKDDGSLWAWGYNQVGQLGLGMDATGIQKEPMRVGEDNDWSYVSAGLFHGLAIKNDGTLWGWGEGGMVGDGSDMTRYSPVAITTSEPPAGPALLSIAVTPATASIPNGAKQEFAAVGSYDDNTTQLITDQVVWSSTDYDIASIYNTGFFMGTASAYQVGSVTISAALGDAIPGTATLNVVGKSLVSITVTPADITLQAGQMQQFTATGHYDDNSTENITASAEWEGIYGGEVPIVIVGNTGGGKGSVTGLAPGEATIRATLGGVSGETGVIVSIP